MRISDWSSDVCSSDLRRSHARKVVEHRERSLDIPHPPALRGNRRIRPPKNLLCLCFVVIRNAQAEVSPPCLEAHQYIGCRDRAGIGQGNIQRLDLLTRIQGDMEVAEKRFAARDPLGVAFVAVLRNFLIGGWRESFGGPQQDLPRLHGPLLRLVRTKIGDDRMSLLRSEEHTSELQSL